MSLPLHALILSALLLAATIASCLALVPQPKHPKQAPRREVVDRMAHVDAALHPRGHRRSSACTLPTGTAPPAVSSQYLQCYSGSGLTEDSANPGNPDPDAYPPITIDLSYLDIPSAVAQCAQLTQRDPLAYASFNLHFLISTCSWIWVQYINRNEAHEAPSYFDQPDADVAIGYGYSILLQ